MSENGNGHQSEERAAGSWANVDGGDPASVRKAILEIGSFTQEALNGILRLEQAFQTHRAEESSGFSKLTARLDEIEGVIIRVDALSLGTATRVARIDMEKDIRVEDMRRVVRESKAISIQLAELDKREAVNATKSATRVEALEKRDEDMQEEIENTGQRNIDKLLETKTAVLEVRARLESSADLDKEKVAERREESHEARADRRSVRVWALGLVGAVVLLVLSTVLAWRFGVASVHPPALPGAPASEH